MRENLSKSIKCGLVFGIVGALVTAIGYELYGNLSRSVSIFLILAFSVYVGVKFSKIPLKEAFVGLVMMYVLNIGFSIVTFLLIHPLTVKFLNEHSAYFPMTLVDSFKYFMRAGLAYSVTCIVCVAKAICVGFYRKLKKNSELTKSYIDNAFDD